MHQNLLLQQKCDQSSDSESHPYSDDQHRLQEDGVRGTGLCCNHPLSQMKQHLRQADWKVHDFETIWTGGCVMDLLRLQWVLTEVTLLDYNVSLKLLVAFCRTMAVASIKHYWVWLMSCVVESPFLQQFGLMIRFRCVRVFFSNIICSFQWYRLCVIPSQDSESFPTTGPARASTEANSLETERAEGNGSDTAAGGSAAPSPEGAAVSLEELQHLAGDADIKVCIWTEIFSGRLALTLLCR